MLEFLFLGTGAANWEKQEDGSEFRRHSAALVNNELMLDCGNYVFDFAESMGDLNLYDSVMGLIITHNHSDHFSKETVYRLAENKRIIVGCDRDIMNRIGEHPNIEFVIFNPYVSANIGAYEIIPLLANHHVVINGDSCAFNYIIKTPEGKEIFYGLDGAWFLRPSWNEMKNHKFDVMVLDCTVGDKEDWRLCEHNTIPMIRMLAHGIREESMVSDDGVIVASHIAKVLHKSHNDTKNILEKEGIVTAYDGMKLVL